MSYTEPVLVEVSLEVSDVQRDFGQDTASGCSNSCCFTRESSSW